MRTQQEDAVETCRQMLDALQRRRSGTSSTQRTRRTAWRGIEPLLRPLNQGPIVLMIENYRTRLLWSLMKECLYLVNGLRRAGFEGGWPSRPENRSASDVDREGQDES